MYTPRYLLLLVVHGGWQQWLGAGDKVMPLPDAILHPPIALHLDKGGWARERGETTQGADIGRWSVVLAPKDRRVRQERV